MEKIKKIEKELKKALEGCEERATTGGTCGNLSIDEKLVFNKDLTDSKLEKTKVFCLECWKNIFFLQGKLITLKEIEKEIDGKIDWIRFTQDSKSFLKLTKKQREALTEETINLLESLKKEIIEKTKNKKQKKMCRKDEI